MANVRCPMCSKVNAADAEECAFCGARLKPLKPSSSLSHQSPTAGSEDDEPEWLRELRSGGQLQNLRPTDADSSSESEQAEIPDWLTRIREKARADTDSSEGMTDDGNLDQPDWMRDLQAESGSPGDAGTETGDWLERLQQEGLPAKPEGGEVGISAGDEEDWTGTFPAWQSSQAGTGIPPVEVGGGLDSLDNASVQPVAPAEAPSSPDDQLLSGTGLTGFLASLEKRETGRLKSLPVEGDQALPEDQPTSEELSGLGPTGFLSALEPGQEDIQEQPEVWAEEPVEDLPAWLRGLDQTSEAPVEDIPVEQSLPNWLSSLEPEAPGLSANPAPVGQEGDETASLPEWLSDEFTTVGQSPDRPETGGEELPDWFASLGSSAQTQEVLPAETEGEPGELAAAGLLAGMSKAAEPTDEQQPAGEPILTGAVDQEEAVPAEPAGVPPVQEEETPDWLRAFAVGALATAGGDALRDQVEAEPVEPANVGGDELVTPEELPDWLSEETGEVPAEILAQPSDQPSGEEIAQAELPEWVLGMRPIESVNLTGSDVAEADQRVERAGPLAGLLGVLTAEELVTRYRKPPIYSARLRVSEKQRSQASLLESILAQEAQPLLIPHRRSQAPRQLGRALVALFFIIVFLIPFMVPLGLEPDPMRTPPELKNMFEEIDGSTETSRPVLLSVDYEPALAGEMQMTALPVVEHLMAKNIPIVVISTVPSGPLLAQSLLSTAAEQLAGQAQPQTYDLSSMTVNLGYLPGGTISLLDFANYPRQAAPASVAGDYEVWNQGILQAVTGLKDFSQVIVITDSAEIGRAWVEQVEPSMGQIPLLMVSSAQAEPMLMPYIDSQQIDGLTAGILGGIIYSQWRQVGSPADAYWPSYQVGMGLAFLLVLACGLLSGFIALQKRSDKGEA